MLDLVGGKRRVDLRLFAVIAALSERVVSLDSILKNCIEKMDFGALDVKLRKAKEMFYVNDPRKEVCLQERGKKKKEKPRTHEFTFTPPYRVASRLRTCSLS